MGHKNKQKLIILAAMATAFLAIIAFQSSGETEQFPVPKANSLQDVKQYQYEKVPGLQRAENLGLTRDYQIEQPIPGTDRTLRIEEVWYNRRQAYIFYSLNFLPLKQKLDDSPSPVRLPYISFSISLPKGAPSVHALSTNKAIFYDGRLYRVARADSLPIPDDSREIENIVLKPLNALIEGKTYSLQAVKLALAFTTKQEPVQKVKLHKTYTIKDYSLTLDEFVIGTFGNKLTFHFAKPFKGEDLEAVELTVQSDKGNRLSLLEKIKEGNQYEYLFEPFDHLPEKIKVHIKGIKMMTSDYFRFKINLTNLQKSDKRIQVDGKLAKIKDTNIMLDSVRYNSKGLQVQIRNAPANKKKPGPIRLTAAVPHFPRKNWTQDADRPLMLFVSNERLDRFAYEGKSAVESDSVYRFTLDSNYLEGLKRIRIAVQNLPFVIQVDKSFTFSSVNKQ
ncbi:MAG TPA: hypothetical protein VF199_13715 [Bacillales bacterium]